MRKKVWKPLVSKFEEKFADRYLSILQRKGIISSSEYNKEKFIQVREKIRETFSCSKKSSIRPEEERLLYAIGEIVKPQSIIGVGSYFGYGISWIIAGMDPNGKAYLIDPDQEVSKLAQSNFEKLGLGQKINIINADFFDSVNQLPKTDLVWIDASGPRDSTILDHRFKKIYGPIIESIDSHVINEGIVIAHNVLPLSNKTGRFKQYIKQNYSSNCIIPSGCGVCVTKK